MYIFDINIIKFILISFLDLPLIHIVFKLPNYILYYRRVFCFLVLHLIPIYFKRENVLAVKTISFSPSFFYFVKPKLIGYWIYNEIRDNDIFISGEIIFQ